MAYIEYCNYAKGTKWSDLRRSHGYEQPHKVKYWCLGNEMDGPWQMGRLDGPRVRPQGARYRAAGARHRPGRATHRLRFEQHHPAHVPQVGPRGARRVLRPGRRHLAAQLLRQRRPNSPAASPSASSRRTSTWNGRSWRSPPWPTTCRACYRSPKKLWLSFDEWNVWYRARTPDHLDGKGKFAPHLLEEVYNLEDALLNGGFLNTLMRQSDRVRVACLAQIVNVIAPLVTNSKGMLRQSIYYPYQMVLKYARGRMLDIQVESETYPIRAAGLRADFARDEEVPFLDVVATYDAKEKRVAVFALNRDLANERELSLNFEDIAPSKVLAAETVTGPDLKAFNTFESPNKVVMTKLDAAKAGAQDDAQAAGALVQRRSTWRSEARMTHSRRDAFKLFGAGAAAVCAAPLGAVSWPGDKGARRPLLPTRGQCALAKGRFSLRRNSTRPIYCGSSPTACCTTSA